MIISREPISMSESLEYVDKSEETGKEIVGFIKKFVKITPKTGKEIRKKIKELNLIKLKEEDISKIIDLLPETKEELNKILIDVSLDEDETTKIINTIKEFK